MDRFAEMRVFAAVVDAGSFVGATGTLEMSKAAVSRHVAELESRLGVRLLHRTTRKLSLTPEGEVFHMRCRELLTRVTGPMALTLADVTRHDTKSQLGSGPGRVIWTPACTDTWVPRRQRHAAASS